MVSRLAGKPGWFPYNQTQMTALKKKEASLKEVGRLLAAVGLKQGTRQTRKTQGKTTTRRAKPTPHKVKKSARRAGTARKAQPPGAARLLQSPLLMEIGDSIRHGFSLRPGGKSTVYGGCSLNLGFTDADSAANVESNRKLLLRLVAGKPVAGRKAGMVVLQQVHSDLIHVLREKPVRKKTETTLSGDGLITNVPGSMLAIQTADCIPVLLADPKRNVVAAFHAGWRGTVRRIVEKGAGRMCAEFGSHPEDILAAIGPGIHACCYSVGEEVRHQFESQFAYARELFSEVYDSDPIKEKYPLLFLTARAPGHSNIGPGTHLDLIEANRRQLLDAGIPGKNIWVSDLCTSCRTDLLFSHRAEHGFTGRMMSVIGILGGKS